MPLRHYIVPLIITVFSIVVILVAMQLDESPPMIVGDSMQPRAFPIFLMVINLVLVAVLVLQLRANTPKTIEVEPFATWGSMALMILFYALTTWVDMFVGIAVVMFGMSLLWGGRIWVSVLTAVLTPLLVFMLFDQVLRIRFPRGLLTNWYYG